MDTIVDTLSPHDVLRDLWTGLGLPPAALGAVSLPARGAVVLPSSFAVATAAQSSLAAAALAAVEIGRTRGGPDQRVTVDAEHAVLDSMAWFRIDGVSPPVWDPLSGLYRCTDGWLRLHANFAHHRDGALRLLGLPTGAQVERSSVADAMARWSALDFEAAAAEAGLVASAARSFADWDAHPQAAALARQPLVAIERIGDASPRPAAVWPRDDPAARPLDGLRVLELTRILAGPVAGRTLAAYGAEVMLVNSPRLPNIAAIADTSRGKLSVQLDLDHAAGRDALQALVREADVFLQGYRPGALAARGFGARALAQASPGIVVTSLSAYGPEGPWSTRRGFDSLVQTATGFNLAEAAAFSQPEPRALPLQILDYAAGYLLAFGTQAALLRQRREGGSWHVQVSLAGVGRWLRSLGRVDRLDVTAPSVEPYVQTVDSGYGRLDVLRHAAQLPATPARWSRPSMPPGSHPARWP